MAQAGRVARQDIAVVVLGTAVCALLAVRFDLSERFLALTHAEEWAQLDEVPQILLVLAVFLSWFSWRRLSEARQEIALRAAAEQRLEDALQEIRRLGSRHTDIQEEERRSLAREIHDELGQYLVALRLAAAATDRDADAARELRDLKAAIIRHVDHMHASVREILARLRPAGLDELGLAVALDNLVQGWRDRLCTVDILLDTDALPLALPEEHSLALYRLAQECLVNLSRHAQAGRATLQLRHVPGESGTACIEFTARDDGRGCDPQGLRQGYGLAGMRERVEALGGSFAIDAAPGHGFVVRARIPCRGAP